eukprot:TRINITY_DN47513_c0_g1_i3.p1 TRINITY_DN47513_c0_g1~~TRINITY_DN47513_c0_g1_i3.p1  ORF type:complete len:742 (-),score=155.69 TRINITY_DN47513_c0_g1_i3:38-2263(-)
MDPSSSLSKLMFHPPSSLIDQGGNPTFPHPSHHHNHLVVGPSLQQQQQQQQQQQHQLVDLSTLLLHHSSLPPRGNLKIQPVPPPGSINSHHQFPPQQQQQQHEQEFYDGPSSSGFGVEDPDYTDDEDYDEAFERKGSGAGSRHSSSSTANYGSNNRRSTKSGTGGGGSASDESSQRKSCETCGKTFANASRLSRHLKTHLGARPFACEWAGCDASYTRMEHLNRHVMSVHTGERPWPCTVEGCQFAFITKQKLERHLKSHVSLGTRRKNKKFLKLTEEVGMFPPAELQSVDQSEFPCDKCEAVLPNYEAFLEHTFSHGGEKLYACPEPDCAKAFDKAASLTKHFHAVHDQRKFTCTFGDGTCNERFDHMRDLSIHLAEVHDMPYSCFVSGCEAICNCSEDLNAHIQICHPAHFDSLQCSLCGKTFAKQSLLNGHVKRVHEAPKFNCDVPFCNRVFRSEETAKEHSAMHVSQLSTKNMELGEIAAELLFQQEQQQHQHQHHHHLNLLASDLAKAESSREAALQESRGRKKMAQLVNHDSISSQVTKKKTGPRPKPLAARIGGLSARQFSELQAAPDLPCLSSSAVVASQSSSSMVISGSHHHHLNLLASDLAKAESSREAALQESRGRKKMAQLVNHDSISSQVTKKKTGPRPKPLAARIGGLSARQFSELQAAPDLPCLSSSAVVASQSSSSMVISGSHHHHHQVLGPTNNSLRSTLEIPPFADLLSSIPFPFGDDSHRIN